LHSKSALFDTDKIQEETGEQANEQVEQIDIREITMENNLETIFQAIVDTFSES